MTSTKFVLYMSHIFPVLIHDSMIQLISHAVLLEVSERKFLNIFDPVPDNATNNNLFNLINDMDKVRRINVQRQRWLGHVVWMIEAVPERRVFYVGISGRQRGEWPWTIIISSLGVSNRIMRKRNTGAW